MDADFSYVFPSIRGIQANREYYVVMCPLRIIPKIFIFDEEELPPEYRAQRLLNRNRIPQIASYIIENPHDYVFSSLTASIDGPLHFTPLSNSKNESITLGNLVISMDSRFVINDGQHRRAAIEEALRQNPALGSETISVVFFHDQGLHRCQQLFADLNRHAVNTTRSIGILYESRDPLAMLSKECVETIPLLSHLTDRETSSIAKHSTKLFQLSTIHSTTKRLLNSDHQNVSKEARDFALLFWQSLCTYMPDWKQVHERKNHARQIRTEYIHTYGVVLEALAIIASDFFATNNQKDFIQFARNNLKTINWSRSNTTDWLDRLIGTNGRIQKNTTGIRLTANRIKQLSNIPLTDFEKTLELEFQNRRKRS